jgi:Putative auto-transporter adhesin, head GIN domain
MKKAIIIALGICYSLTAAAQGEGIFIEASNKKAKEIRTISTFSKLDVSGCFEVQLVKEDGNALTLTGADNILPLIITESHGDTLSIHLKDGLQIQPSLHNKVTIKVPFAYINAISLYGAGSITSKSTITTNIDLKLDGAGAINLKLYSPKSTVNMVGAGNISLQGYSEAITCKLTGSGSITAGDLNTETADVILMGSGSIKVSSNKKIKGRINGSGSVALGGKPDGQDLMRTGTGEFSAF